MGTLLAVSFWGGRGVLNCVPYWQFHFGEGGGFQIGHPISSFILGREGVSNWAPYWHFHFGEGGGVHLQADWKSVRFMDSDWLSTLPRADSCAKKSKVTETYFQKFMIILLKFIYTHFFFQTTMPVELHDL